MPIVFTHAGKMHIIMLAKQRWSRGHNLRGQGQRLEKIRGQGPTFREQALSRPRTEMVKAKTKDQEHKFSKSWSANFPLFLSAKVFKILHFVKFFMIIRK